MFDSPGGFFWPYIENHKFILQLAAQKLRDIYPHGHDLIWWHLLYVADSFFHHLPWVLKRCLCSCHFWHASIRSLIQEAKVVRTNSSAIKTTASPSCLYFNALFLKGLAFWVKTLFKFIVMVIFFFSSCTNTPKIYISPCLKGEEVGVLLLSLYEVYLSVFLTECSNLGRSPTITVCGNSFTHLFYKAACNTTWLFSNTRTRSCCISPLHAHTHPTGVKTDDLLGWTAATWTVLKLLCVNI